jgi:hypothetical protein
VRTRDDRALIKVLAFGDAGVTSPLLIDANADEGVDGLDEADRRDGSLTSNCTAGIVIVSRSAC